MSVLSLLASSNFITYNKEIAKKYGIEEAILLGAMCGYQTHYESEEFYREQEKILDETALTLYGLRKAMKTLTQNGLITIKKKGIPAKFYYKVNEDKIVDIVMSRHCENDRSGTIENNTTNNKNNNKNKEFNNIYSQVCDYLNEKCGTHYKANTPKTQQLIRARQNEGFELDDFKKVIDNMSLKWKGSEWEQYLRPETLFGTKFESYLNVKNLSYGNKKSNFEQRVYGKDELNSLFDSLDDVEI